MGAKKENFKLLKFLGAGGFAQTYVAEVLDDKLRKEWGREVAIKIPLSKEKERTLISELITNASLHLNLQGVRAKNIVRYLGFDMYDEQYIMVMEYVKGCSLRSMIGSIGRQEILPVDTALNITEQVCSGLIELHNIHIYHRDLKPENIMVCEEDGIVKIMDLGIARMISSAELASTTTGTIYYMPKELVKGKGGSFYSDIYSVGVTMYEMLTGQLPFDGESLGDIIDNICNKDPDPPMSINPQIDERLNKIILKAMSRNIDKRYKMASELSKAIENYKQGIEDEEELIDRYIAETGELFSTDKLREAEKRLKELLEKYPNNPKSYLSLGEFYNRCQRYLDAIKIFEMGTHKRQDYALFYRDMALSLYQVGSKKEAAYNLKKAIELGLEPSLEKHAVKLLELWERR